MRYRGWREVGMRKPLPEGYVGKGAAAERLGITVDGLWGLVRRGVLRAHAFPYVKPRGFALTELQAYESNKHGTQTDARHAHALALAALSTARRLEERVADMYDFLGLGLAPLRRSDSDILTLRAEVQRSYDRAALRDPGWLRYWGGVFFGIDETYFELTTYLTGDEEPWKLFLDFAARVAKDILGEDDPELYRAYRFFDQGRQHLRNVGYLQCRHRVGVTIANKVFDGRHSAVDELFAVLHR